MQRLLGEETNCRTDALGSVSAQPGRPSASAEVQRQTFSGWVHHASSCIVLVAQKAQPVGQ